MLNFVHHSAWNTCLNLPNHVVANWWVTTTCLVVELVAKIVWNKYRVCLVKHGLLYIFFSGAWSCSVISFSSDLLTDFLAFFVKTCFFSSLHTFEQHGMVVSMWFWMQKLLWESAKEEQEEANIHIVVQRTELLKDLNKHLFFFLYVAFRMLRSDHLTRSWVFFFEHTYRLAE